MFVGIKNLPGSEAVRSFRSLLMIPSPAKLEERERRLFAARLEERLQNKENLKIEKKSQPVDSILHSSDNQPPESTGGNEPLLEKICLSSLPTLWN